MEFYSIYFDGSCGPKNPGGKAAFGFTVYHGPEKVNEGKGIIGEGPEMTNNLAEFFAFYQGLRCFNTMLLEGKIITPCNVHVKGDSQLVVKIMNRKWRANASKPYFPAFEKADSVLRTVRKNGAHVSISWVPRKKNEECDKLSKSLPNLMKGSNA